MVKRASAANTYKLHVMIDERNFGIQKYIPKMLKHKARPFSMQENNKLKLG